MPECGDKVAKPMPMRYLPCCSSSPLWPLARRATSPTYCGNVSNFELERANCNQIAVDALEMQQALSGWQRRP